MLYVTLLDQFHPGIYSSQVIDVCDFLNKKFDAKIRIVAFLSIREISSAKPKLKALSPDAIVLPAFPKINYFQLTAILLFLVCLFTGQRKVICRNVFCTRMALRLKSIGFLKKVILDGRGAMAAEIREYDVFPVDYFRDNTASIEKYSVLNADYRLAVSNKLVNYWQEEYGYAGNEHVIVPCTLDSKYFTNVDIKKELEKSCRLKMQLGYLEEDIIFVYAGSTAPWQSFSLIENFFTPLLDQNKNYKIMFLSKENEDNIRFRNKFPNQVSINWVEHKEVANYLMCADYGILLREQSVTNRVASPTKFAEYLISGLQVIISDNLGDFSEFVKETKCGKVISEYNKIHELNFKRSVLDEKLRIINLGMDFFLKDSSRNISMYKKLKRNFCDN